MYTLREIDRKLGTSNTALGDHYSVIMKAVNEKQFLETVKQWDEKCLKDLYGLVVFDGADGSLMPLYKGREYYVMTDSGKTFEKL